MYRWENAKDKLKCRIPGFPLHRRVAEIRFDCCPRPRTPFLLVSEAALALAERERETEQNTKKSNTFRSDKAVKKHQTSVVEDLVAKRNFAAII